MRVPFGRLCVLVLAVAAGGCGGPKPLFTAGDAPAVILDRAVEAQGGESHQGRTLVVLRTRSREFGLVDLYLDAATGLPAKTVKVIPAGGPLPAGSYGTMEFSDYRDLDGLKFPFRIVMTANGKPAAD